MHDQVDTSSRTQHECSDQQSACRQSNDIDRMTIDIPSAVRLCAISIHGASMVCDDDSRRRPVMRRSVVSPAIDDAAVLPYDQRLTVLQVAAVPICSAVNASVERCDRQLLQHLFCRLPLPVCLAWRELATYRDFHACAWHASTGAHHIERLRLLANDLQADLRTQIASSRAAASDGAVLVHRHTRHRTGLRVAAASDASRHRLQLVERHQRVRQQECCQRVVEIDLCHLVDPPATGAVCADAAALYLATGSDRHTQPHRPVAHIQHSRHG